MKYYLFFASCLFISLSFWGCSDPCEGAKTEMTVDLDQAVFLKQLAGENLNPGFIRVVDSISNSVKPYNQSLLFDLIEFYETGGGQGGSDELFSCFPIQEDGDSSGLQSGDFSGLQGFLVSASDDSFRIMAEILKRRFEGYENMCATHEIQKDGFHLTFTDSLRSVGEKLISTRGYFEILETANYAQLEDVFQLADTLLSGLDTSATGQSSLSFRGLFNPDVLPNPQSPVIGESTVADSGKITQIIFHPKMQSLLEVKQLDLLWTKADARIGGDKKDAGLQLIAVKRSKEGQNMGLRIREAFVGGIEGKPAVRISLDAAGAMELRSLTESNRKRSLAMVLDDVVWQLAKVNEPLIEGKFELTGGLSEEQSKIMAAVLNSGALPVPVQLR